MRTNYSILFLFLSFFTLETLAASPSKSGPYRLIMLRSGSCKFTYCPYKHPPAVFQLRIYKSPANTILFRGNLTLFRNVSDGKVKIKTYIWESGKWKLNYMADQIGCKAMLMPLICAAMNIKYDKRHCTIPKGNYHFEDIDPNKLTHMFARKLEYGKTLWTAESYMAGKPFKTIFCFEYETLIEPA